MKSCSSFYKAWWKQQHVDLLKSTELKDKAFLYSTVFYSCFDSLSRVHHFILLYSDSKKPEVQPVKPRHSATRRMSLTIKFNLCHSTSLYCPLLPNCHWMPHRPGYSQNIHYVCLFPWLSLWLNLTGFSAGLQEDAVDAEATMHGQISSKAKELTWNRSGSSLSNWGSESILCAVCFEET